MHGVGVALGGAGYGLAELLELYDLLELYELVLVTQGYVGRFVGAEVVGLPVEELVADELGKLYSFGYTASVGCSWHEWLVVVSALLDELLEDELDELYAFGYTGFVG